VCARARVCIYNGVYTHMHMHIHTDALTLAHTHTLEHTIQYPLWYPRYDGVADMSCFNTTLPFAGWTSVSIKQYSGDADLCGLSQVDLDFQE